MESRVRWNDTTGASGTISILRWADQLSFLALGQLTDALIPTSYDLSHADAELKRLASRHR